MIIYCLFEIEILTRVWYFRNLTILASVRILACFHARGYLRIKAAQNLFLCITEWSTSEKSVKTWKSQGNLSVREKSGNFTIISKSQEISSK